MRHRCVHFIHTWSYWNYAVNRVYSSSLSLWTVRRLVSMLLLLLVFSVYFLAVRRAQPNIHVVELRTIVYSWFERIGMKETAWNGLNVCESVLCMRLSMDWKGNCVCARSGYTYYILQKRTARNTAWAHKECNICSRMSQSLWDSRNRFVILVQILICFKNNWL